MTEKFGENFEKIDNEKIINNKLDKKENNVALGILKMIDIQIPNIDIDLSYDKKENNYYFIANNKPLDIPFKLNNLPKFGKILIKLFNNDIQLFGSLYGRSIAKDTWLPDGFEEKYIKNKDFSLSKNDIEEIFVFIMNAKKIKKEDWKIESTVCKGAVDNNCKEALGN